MDDFYSDAEVRDVMQSVLSKSYYQFLVLRTLGGSVAGFTYGYAEELEKLNRDKLGIDPARWEGCKRAMEGIR